MEHDPNRKWKGETKVVVGIDIGTTQSAVAIGLLEHGVEVTKALHSVTEWPGQDLKQAKIPTAIWYDTNGKAVFFGADTITPEIEERAEDSHWFLAKYFKLLLHPEELKVRGNLEIEKDPFRYGVTIEQVYSDFMKYLLGHTEKYFKDWIIDGEKLWSRHRNKMEFVIAHPNAWRTSQQTFLRKVAVQAGLVSSTQAKSNIRFVSEAEASIHFCLADPKLNLRSHLKPGTIFAVCDAGGSTVDTTVYTVTSTTPSLTIEEKKASGSLRKAGVSDEEDVAKYVKVGKRDFEAGVKRLFSNEAKDHFIKLGERRVNFPLASIRRGHMYCHQTILHDCVKQIFASVDEQVQGIDTWHILLVGGFGDSPHLRGEFRNRYAGQECQVKLTESSTAKAVANGTIIWSYSGGYRGIVTSRAPRSTYGATCAVIRDSGNPNHQGRESYVGVDGCERLSGKWDTIVTKGVPLQIHSVNRSSYVMNYTTPHPNLANFEQAIEAYINENPPYWSQNNDGFFKPGFRTECKVTANLKKLSGALEMKIGQGGRAYWELEFSLCIRFGGIEFEGYIEWEENGETRSGPVTILEDEIFSG
ncbi:hypothetical protein B0J17DRAFT_711008 [Rhizoctonia solani]|nr:hypothetical protein B0J17DRAFT_711008 [Rhizoctonia solani]